MKRLAIITVVIIFAYRQQSLLYYSTTLGPYLHTYTPMANVIKLFSAAKSLITLATGLPGFLNVHVEVKLTFDRSGTPVLFASPQVTSFFAQLACPLNDIIFVNIKNDLTVSL
jgi:hypothetical protein